MDVSGSKGPGFDHGMLHPVAHKPVRTVEDEERRRRLHRRHRLDRTAENVGELARDLIALHSSDPATVYLSAWGRIPDFEVEDLEASLYDDRSLVRYLGMRRTLFVVERDLVGVVHHSSTAKLGPPERRRLIRMIEEQGIAGDGADFVRRVVADVRAALERRGPSTAAELKEDVEALDATLTFGEGKKWGGTFGVSTRILFLMATEGDIVRARPLGTWRSGQYRWALVEDWLGDELAERTRASAQAELLARWLARFGPATADDIQWWTGWTKTDTKRALDAVDVARVSLATGEGYVLWEDVDEEPEFEDDTVTLLPSLDPTTMGWKSREWHLGGHAGALFDRNGNAGPTIWHRGRVIGGWAQRADGTVATRLLEPVGTDVQAGVSERAEALSTWLGEHRVIPRFRTPLDRELTRE